MAELATVRAAGAAHVAAHIARLPTKPRELRIAAMRNILDNCTKTLKSGTLTEIETAQYEGAVEWTREQLRIAKM